MKILQLRQGCHSAYRRNTDFIAGRLVKYGLIITVILLNEVLIYDCKILYIAQTVSCIGMVHCIAWLIYVLSISMNFDCWAEETKEHLQLIRKQKCNKLWIRREASFVAFGKCRNAPCAYY